MRQYVIERQSLGILVAVTKAMGSLRVPSRDTMQFRERYSDFKSRDNGIVCWLLSMTKAIHCYRLRKLIPGVNNDSYFLLLLMTKFPSGQLKNRRAG